MVNSQQRHIWYDTGTSCNVSFFDADEIKDLSEHTISDFFKDLAAPERS